MLTRHVFLFDDDYDDLMLSRHALERALARQALSARIHATQKGAELIGAVADMAQTASGDNCALFILDLKAPDVNGITILEWLSERGHKGCGPVLMLTGSTLEDEIAQAFRLGANAYYQKPDSTAGLNALFEGIVQHWFMLSKLPHMRCGD